MGLTLITGPAASGKTYLIFQKIRQSLMQDQTRRIIYIVPEQVTMKIQKQLLSFMPGESMMGVQVLSFKRLSYRVLSQTGMGTESASGMSFLSDTGKAMVLYKIARDHQDELVYYGRVVSQRGFIGQMKLMITEIIQYGLDEPVLRQMASSQPEGSILRAKLQDIALLWHYFLEYTKDHALASESLLDLLSQQLQGAELLTDALVFIDDFDGFTTQEYRVIAGLLLKAKQVYISLSMTDSAFSQAESLVLDGRSFKELPRQLFYTVQKTLIKLIEEAKGLGMSYDIIHTHHSAREYELTFVMNALTHMRRESYRGKARHVFGISCQNPEKEAQAVFECIRGMMIREGLKLRDIAVLCCGLENYRQSLISLSSLYGFSLFIDERTQAAENPLLQLLEAMGSVLRTSFSQDSLLQLLKTSLLGLDEAQTDRLENEILRQNIFGYDRLSQLLLSFGEEAMDDLAHALTNLYEGTKGKILCGGYIRAYLDFLDACKVQEKLESWALSLEEGGLLSKAAEYRRIYEEAIKLQKELSDILGEVPIDTEGYTQLLKIGLEQLKLGHTPPSLDELLVGDLKRTKLTACKVIFLMGVRGGSFPWSEEGQGLITDHEREKLSGTWELAAGEREKLTEQYYLLYQMMGKAEKRMIFTSCSLLSDGTLLTPSPLWKRLQAVCGEGWELSAADQEENLSGEKDAPFLALPPPKALLYRERDGLAGPYADFLSSLGFGEDLSVINKGRDYHLFDGALDPKTASLMLDPTRKSLSVTQLERYAQCPFSYFLRYGISLKEREKPQVRMLEDGNVLHDMLKEAGEYLKLGLSREEAGRLSRELLEKRTAEFGVYQTSGRYRYYWQKLQKTAAKAFYALSSQAVSSDFKQSAFEWAFGIPDENGKMTNRDFAIGGVRLIGKIDRVDLLDMDGERFAMVIDYKSGRTGYDPSDIYAGVSLQLPIYLEVAKDRFDAKPAGFFYFHLSQKDSETNKLKDLSDEAILQDQLKNARLDGVFTNRPEIAFHMDRGIPEGDPRVLKARLTKTGKFHAGDHTASEENFADLSAFVKHKVTDLSRKMQEGKIAASPLKDSKGSACRYCTYRSICPFDEHLPGAAARKKETMKDKEFWKRLEEEN